MVELLNESILVLQKLSSYHPSWNNLGENKMVKVTLHDKKYTESFWVWIESIESNTYIIGIISNQIISNKLKLGQRISFHIDFIKEISNRSYTKEETKLAIYLTNVRNNPITKYFNSINPKFN